MMKNDEGGMDSLRRSLQEDAARATVGPLEDYLARFPGDAAAVAREYIVFVDGSRIYGDVRGAPGAAAETVARRVGPYRLVRELGRGGQGAVYLAEDVRVRRNVALKLLDESPFRSDEALERFRREATIGAKLDHPGICPVYDVGLEGRTPFLAMKLVAGETLAHKIARSRERGASEGAAAPSHVELPSTDGEALPAAPSASSAAPPAARDEILRIVRLVEQAARALHAAHEAGVVHRDVKPANCMVGADGSAVLLDFGLAADTEGDLPTLTRTGDLMGTPAYMSPEQLAARRIRLDRRTDVYSLGATLYECLTLRRPFEAPTREGLYQAIMTKEAPNPARLNPAISRDLRVVVATAMEKDRDRRYATARDFADDLGRVARDEPIAARPASVWTKSYRWIRRNPALAAAAAATFASLAGGLATSLILLDQKENALGEKAAALDDYEKLGDVSRLARLRAAERELWPAVPAQIPALRGWLHEAEDLAARLPRTRAVRDALRAADGPHATDATRFKLETMSRLAAELESFVDADPRIGALASVRARIAEASAIEAATVGPGRKDAWAAASGRVADPAGPYRGLTLRPQLGLVPIGPDPHSRLEEFAHWASAAADLRSEPAPRRLEDGRLDVAEAHGLIFVLLPGGTFTMGARRPTPEEQEDLAEGEPPPPNVDPMAEEFEGPPHVVALEPFFLSKFELTQAQWLRFSKANLSAYAAGKAPGNEKVTGAHPVTNVSWNELTAAGGWLKRAGCDLPTEAQWEFACRAGKTTPWWTGDRRASLRGAANVHDALSRKKGAPPSWGAPDDWNDDFIVHAPVGRFAANPFGLHDVHGNVWEWCLDAGVDYGDRPARAGDGLRGDSATARMYVIRGGAFDVNSNSARSSYRGGDTPGAQSPVLGVRPARSVDR